MLAPPYRKLALFAGNLATCFAAGIGPQRSLESTRRTLAGTRYQSAVDAAGERIQDGAALSEALSEGDSWPPFFIPLLKAGEQTGRLDEALRFLEHHCKLLDGPARAFQNSWLVPLSIMLLSSGLQFGISLFFGSVAQALWFAWSSIQSYGLLALVVFPFIAPPFRSLVDPLKLAVPFLGSIEREMALNRFFRVMSLLYAAGGQRVEAMIRTAARTVPNLAVRKSLLKAAVGVEEGSSVAEAFESPTCLTEDEKDTIAASDMAGTLEAGFERISQNAGEVMEGRLKSFQQFSIRLIMLAASLSLAISVMRVASRSMSL